MSETHSSDSPAGREEMLSAIFAQMVLQQSNLAMMLLGKIPHPQTGKKAVDIEGARMFIDQLEMLEAKTKSNLSRDEEMLLKQSLMSLRLAFVEAVESPGAPEAEEPPASGGAVSETGSGPGSAAAEEESKKKFSKKY